MNKHWLRIAAALALAATLAGCTAQTPAQTTLSAPATAPAAPEAKVHLAFIQEFEGPTKTALTDYAAAVEKRDLAAVQKLTAGDLRPQRAEELTAAGLKSFKIGRMMYDGATQENGKQVAYMHASFEVALEPGKASHPWSAGANERYVKLVQESDGWKIIGMATSPFPGITWG